MNPGLRIAQLSRTPSRRDGGIFFALAGLLPALARSPGQRELAAFGAADPESQADRGQWAPVRVETFRAWPPPSFSYAPGLVGALRAFKPQILHVHGLWSYASVACQRVARRAGTPYLVSPHGMLDPGALQFSKFKKQLAGALFQAEQLRRASALHALTLAEARAIRAAGYAGPVAILPNGVDLPPLVPSGRARAKPESGRTKTLLFIGRIHPKKGLSSLISAWAPFSGRGSAGEAWRLVIAGWDEGGHEEQLRTQVREANAEDRVTFAGPLWGEAKAEALQQADAFVLPSRSEGLPMSVLEAWASAKPALITPACNLPEGTAAGASLEVQPDADGLARGLERLAALSDSEREEMGRAARRLVEAKFAWPAIAANMLRLYEALASGQTPPNDLLARDS